MSGVSLGTAALGAVMAGSRHPPRTWARKAPVLGLAPQRATSIADFCEQACGCFYQLAICVLLLADMVEPTILNICSRKSPFSSLEKYCTFLSCLLQTHAGLP